MHRRAFNTEIEMRKPSIWIHVLLLSACPALAQMTPSDRHLDSQRDKTVKKLWMMEAVLGMHSGVIKEAADEALSKKQIDGAQHARIEIALDAVSSGMTLMKEIDQLFWSLPPGTLKDPAAAAAAGKSLEGACDKFHRVLIRGFELAGASGAESEKFKELLGDLEKLAQLADSAGISQEAEFFCHTSSNLNDPEYVKKLQGGKPSSGSTTISDSSAVSSGSLLESKPLPVNPVANAPAIASSGSAK